MGLTPEQGRKLGLEVATPTIRPDLQEAFDSANAHLRGASKRSGKQEVASQAAENIEVSPRVSAARAQGATARQEGQQAELEVLESCRWYRARHLAQVDKVPTAVTRHRVDPGLREGWFVASYTPRDVRDGCPVDFVGAARIGGRCRPVRLEVKTSSTGRLPLARHGEAILPAHQVADLELADELGAVAGVLARAAGTWWWWPWRVWVAAVRRAEGLGQASLHQAEVRALGVACGRLPCGGPDWLAAMEAVERKGESGE